ncbi:MAG: glucokinase [Chlamydiae bacterium]|nr:glucokinase [Chlamydiota bacterium]
MYLVGDAGGTKTHIALIDDGRKGFKILSEKVVKSPDYSTLSMVIREFLIENNIKDIKQACFDIAGPVKEGKCVATNLPWVVDSKELAKECSIKEVYLLNDLEASAYGTLHLTESDFFTLHQGIPNQKGNKALIAAGTGLGEAGLFFDGKNYRPFATEGGHADFAPHDELEMKFFYYLQKKLGHVSFERVVSGPGLYAMYRFLVDIKEEPYIETFEQELMKGDPSAIIAERGLKNEVRGCSKALEWFSTLYGAEAGNLALKFLAIGGVYIAGGIAPKILDKLKEGHFMRGFFDKGRFATLLATIPVKVILNENLPLLGCFVYIQKQISQKILEI